MIIGNPDKFAVLIDYVPDWNNDNSFWKEGMFDFIFCNTYLSEKVLNYTLNEFLIDDKPVILLSEIIEDKNLFLESKETAFKYMLNLYDPYILNEYLTESTEREWQYFDGYVLNKHYMSGIWITAVAYQNKVRILGAITDDLVYSHNRSINQWVKRKEILIHDVVIDYEQYNLINDCISAFLRDIL